MRRTNDFLKTGARRTAHGIRTALCVAFLATGLLGLCSCGSEKSGVSGSDARPKLKKVAAGNATDVEQEVVATIQGRSITRGMLVAYAKLAPNSVWSEREILEKPTSALQSAVQDLALTLMVAKHALADDSPMEAEDILSAEREAARMLIADLLEQEVRSKIPQPSSEEIEEFYANNSEAFRSPFTFSMRQIYVSSYLAVETEEGETLESLAERISGDAERVDLILIDSEAKSPRAPGWSTADNSLTIKPLEAGENLLVPLDRAGREERRSRVASARERIEAGEDFETVATEVSDFGHGELVENLPFTGRAMLPQIVAAAQNTPVGELTEVIASKHGFHLMRIEAKTEERLLPLEEVRDQVVEQIVASKFRTARLEYADSLYTMPELTLHYDAIRDPDTPDDVVAVELDGASYTKGDFYDRMVGETSQDMSDEEILTVLRINGRLRNDLLLLRARQLGLDQDPSYLMRVAGQAHKKLLPKYHDAMRKRISKEAMSVEDAKAYFEKHRSELRIPRLFTYHLLRIPLDEREPEAVLTEVAELLADIEDVSAFKSLVAEHAPTESAKQSGGLMREIAESTIHPILREPLLDLSHGAMTHPLLIDGEVRAAWLVERQEPRAPTFEEVRPNLIPLIRQTRKRNLANELARDMLKEAEIVMQ